MKTTSEIENSIMNILMQLEFAHLKPISQPEYLKKRAIMDKWINVLNKSQKKLGAGTDMVNFSITENITNINDMGISRAAALEYNVNALHNKKRQLQEIKKLKSKITPISEPQFKIKYDEIQAELAHIIKKTAAEGVLDIHIDKDISFSYTPENNDEKRGLIIYILQKKLADLRLVFEIISENSLLMRQQTKEKIIRLKNQGR